jgi:hypothetical protein
MRNAVNSVMEIIMKKMAIMAMGMCLASMVSTQVMAGKYAKRSKTSEATMNISKQAPDRCAVSAMDDWVSIDAHLSGLFDAGDSEAIVSFTVSTAAKGNPVGARWDLKTGTKVRTAGPAGPAPGGDCDSAPSEPAQEHAIKTKGMGGDRTNPPIVTKDVADFACDVSGDASNPVVRVRFIRVRSQDKVSVQDISFTRRTTGADGGGMPVVKIDDAIVCSAASGEASSISGLLMPAVQR